MPIGLKGNTDGSGAIQIGGSDAISISTGLNTTFAGTITATGTVAGTTGTLYPLVSGTSVSATGTAVDFTGIPSWVRRITVMFNAVSTNGTSVPLIQLGTSSGVENTGYVSGTGVIQGASVTQTTNVTSGILLAVTAYIASSTAITGAVTLNLIGSNAWVASGTIARETNSQTVFFTAGSKTVAATLDRVRITTVNGTDTFDAGTINILYE
jgi:hypothetical protein